MDKTDLRFKKVKIVKVGTSHAHQKARHRLNLFLNHTCTSPITHAEHRGDEEELRVRDKDYLGCLSEGV